MLEVTPEISTARSPTRLFHLTVHSRLERSMSLCVSKYFHMCVSCLFGLLHSSFMFEKPSPRPLTLTMA